MSNNINNNKQNQNFNVGNNISNNRNTNKIRNINNVNTKIIYNYKQKIDNDKKKIQRPGLTNRENGSIIKFKAMIIGEYRKFNNCVSIINLRCGKEYLADPTQ